jgi:hypothetical protein
LWQASSAPWYPTLQSECSMHSSCPHRWYRGVQVYQQGNW